jgi:hypothetical protein
MLLPFGFPCPYAAAFLGANNVIAELLQNPLLCTAWIDKE